MEQQVSLKNGVPFYNIASGKWRRYFDFRNFTDPFKTIVGIGQAWQLLRKLRPDIIFSKGGFVSFPIVIAGWLRKIPIIAHESDIIPGLTTRLCLPFVTKQCLGFAESKTYFKNHQKKLVVTGIPLRSIILQGDPVRGLQFLGITKKEKPILLILGGSLGAQKINTTITQTLSELTKSYTVIHMTGIGKENIDKQKDYLPYPSFKEELADIYQCADIIVSMAGATTIAEILTIKKPVVLIPLGKDQSRGDQIINAKTFSYLPQIRVLPEEQLSPATLLSAIQELKSDQPVAPYADELSHANACEKVTRLIQDSIFKI